jgi:hypothetical protein
MPLYHLREAQDEQRLEEFRDVIAFNWLFWLGFAVLTLGRWQDGVHFHKQVSWVNARRRKAPFASLGLLLIATPSVYFGIGFRSIAFRAAYTWPFPIYYLPLSIGSFSSSGRF